MTMTACDLTNEIKEFLHYIKTPLATIKIGGNILKDVLPALIHAYKNEKQNETDIDLEKIDKLTGIINNLIVEASRISECTHQLEKFIIEYNDDLREHS